MNATHVPPGTDSALGSKDTRQLHGVQSLLAKKCQSHQDLFNPLQVVLWSLSTTAELQQISDGELSERN